MPQSIYECRITKPPLGAQINWAHPLAQGIQSCWVFNENGGSPFDLARLVAGSLTGTTAWSSSSAGMGVRCLGANSGNALDYGTLSFLYNGSNGLATGPWTWSILFKLNSLATAASVWGQWGSAAGKHLWLLDIETTGKLVSIFTFGAISYEQDSSTGAAAVGNVYEYTVTCPSTVSNASQLNVYLNGTLQSKTNSSFGSAVSGPQHALSGTTWDEGKTADLTVLRAAIWQTQMSLSDVLWLVKEPYAMFYNPAQSFWLFPVSSSTGIQQHPAPWWPFRAG